ncbi:MAG: hypothetical protein WCB09_02945, partial [Methylocella sp.]
RPGCETLAISAGADVAHRALRPRRKLAWFCSAPMAGFYSAVDTRITLLAEMANCGLRSVD